MLHTYLFRYHLDSHCSLFSCDHCTHPRETDSVAGHCAYALDAAVANAIEPQKNPLLQRGPCGSDVPVACLRLSTSGSLILQFRTSLTIFGFPKKTAKDWYNWRKIKNKCYGIVAVFSVFRKCLVDTCTVASFKTLGTCLLRCSVPRSSTLIAFGMANCRAMTQCRKRVSPVLIPVRPEEDQSLMS